MKVLLLTDKVYQSLVSDGYTHLAHIDTEPENAVFDEVNNIITYEAVKGNNIHTKRAYEIQSDRIQHLLRNNTVKCYVIIKKSSTSNLVSASSRAT